MRPSISFTLYQVIYIAVTFVAKFYFCMVMPLKFAFLHVEALHSGAGGRAGESEMVLMHHAPPCTPSHVFPDSPCTLLGT